MPGGLNEVVQQVGADASKYISEYRAALAVTKELAAAQKELAQAQQALGGAGVSSGGAAAAADIAKMNAEIRAGLSLAREYQPAMTAAASATAGLGAAHAAAAAQIGATSAAIRDVTGSTGDMTARFEAARASIGAMAADAQAQSERIVAGFERGSAQVRVFSTDVAGLRSSASDTAAAVDNVSRSIDVLQAKASGAGPSTMGVLGPALAAAAASGGGGAPAWSGSTDAATAAIIARNMAARGYTSSGDPAVHAALGALLGGGAAGGGGGGGGGAAAGGFFGALRPSNIFGGALPTVKMIHMIAMGTMEVLSQVIPAGVAAAAAGMVGLQGGSDVYSRGSALWNAAEALGGTYGNQTLGTLAGLSSNLQKAQDVSQGGVYGIAGGLLDLTKQGGGALTGMGTQTVAMIDRGIAGMVLNGRMKQVTDALSGGTGALRGIGDIGANIGDTLLNVVPALPGMGQDIFSGLKGLTGAAASTTGFLGKTGLLAPLLAGEAGYRWGDLVLGGGKMPWFLGGKQFSGVAGLASRMGLGELPMTAEEAVAAGLAPDLAAAGEGIAGTGLAGLLGTSGAAGPIGLAAALSAFTMSKLSATMPTSQMRQIAGLQGGINQSFGAAALDPITKALYQAAQLTTGAPATGLAASMAQNIPAMETSSQVARFGPQGGMGAPPAAVIQTAVSSFAQQLGELTAAGPQAQKALAGIGDKGASLGEAFDALTMAMISPQDIGKGGVLDKRAVQQLQQFAQTYTTMTKGQPGSAAPILQAAGADYIMSSSAMKSVSQINQGLDSMTQIMTGGPYSLTGVLGTLSGFGAAAPAAKALSSFTTPAGVAAWQSMTDPQTGLITALQASMDQMRTAQTLGATTAAGGAALGAYQIGKILPLAAQSPALLAMLQQQGMQAGIPGLAMGESYKQTAAAVKGSMPSAAEVNRLMTQQVKTLANIPAIATALTDVTEPGQPSALQAALMTSISQQAIAFQQHPLLKGGAVNAQALQGLESGLTAGGVKPGQMKVGVDAVLQNLHVPSNIVAKVNAEITGTPKMPPLPKPPDVSGKIRYENQLPSAVPTQHASGIVMYKNVLTRPSVPTLSGTIVYHAVITGPGNIAGAGQLGSLGGHTGSGMQKGFKVPGFGGGDVWGPAMLEPGELVVPKDMVAGGAVDHLRGRIPGFQSGGVIGVPDLPGLGVSFRVAMEQVAQELLADMQQAVSSVTGNMHPYGGLPMSYGGGSRPLTGGPQPNGTASSPVAVHVVAMGGSGAVGAGGLMPGGGLPVPAAASKIFDAFEKTFASMPSPWKGLASQILNGLIDGIKNAKGETAAMATALVNKVKTEIAFGQSVTNTAVAGLNFGGMQVATPTMTAQGKPYQYYTDQQNIAAGGQPGSVQEQMSSYLQAMKSFQADMGKLAKGGLEKRELSQLYAAGPIQGDAEAQSILGGAGGIKAANNLYNQINSVATKLGVSAIGNVYGQPGGQGGLQGKNVKVGVHADTAAAQAAINAIHGKSVTINVKLDISGGGGTGGGGGGGVDLTPAQVKQVTSKVQAALLQQAKRNRRTGITLPGYGS